MIPKCVSVGGVWNVLPPGVHDATLEEVQEHFATNAARKALYAGFKRGLEALERAGCKTVFLDGSFISDKPNPGDFDACWEPAGVNVEKLDPVLLDFRNGRENQKLKFGGEFFPSGITADGTRPFVEYFQTDKDSGKAKGIIRIRLPLRERGAQQS
jgi:hypothetical protein